MSKNAITALLEFLTLLLILTTLLAYLTGFLSGIPTGKHPVKPSRHPSVKKSTNRFPKPSLFLTNGGKNHARSSRLFKSSS